MLLFGKNKGVNSSCIYYHVALSHSSYTVISMSHTIYIVAFLTITCLNGIYGLAALATFLTCLKFLERAEIGVGAL